MPDNGTDSVRITATASGYNAETKATGADGKAETITIREDSLISRRGKLKPLVNE